MKVLIVATEAVPYCKTGGLADVVGALFRETTEMGLDVVLMLPFYKKLIKNEGIIDTGINFEVKINDRRFKAGIYRHNKTFFIDNELLFGREGIYGGREGDYQDNDIRFAFFSRAVLMACKLLEFRPDVIHLNDWQTALIPLYLKTIHKNDAFFRTTSILFTIHNLGYQGLFPPESLKTIGVSKEFFTPEGIEFYGKVNLLKAGIIFSDIITTVSKHYAEEITTAEYGFGLDGLLRKRRDALFGVLNGIDYNEWSPERDKLIYANYSADDLRGKALCKLDLIKRCNLSFRRGAPIIAYVGRLAFQKGIDLILQVLDSLFQYGCAVVLLGEGESDIMAELQKKSSQWPQQMFLSLRFDDTLAHAIYAGADMLVMPSRYEPCGLVQLIGLRYGTVPVARNTGGLSDTIEDYNGLTDTGTGFLFDEHNYSTFHESLKRALTVYCIKRRWHRLQRRGMNKDFSWRQSARRYLQLYQEAILRRKNEHKG